MKRTYQAKLIDDTELNKLLDLQDPKRGLDEENFHESEHSRTIADSLLKLLVSR